MKKEKISGSVLLLAIIAVIILMLLGYAYLFITQHPRLVNIREEKQSVAFNVAEAGIARAKAWLLMASPTPEYYVENVLGEDPEEPFTLFYCTEEDTGWNSISGSEGEYSVSITPGEDNAGELTRYYTIYSTGRVSGMGGSGYYMRPIVSGVFLHLKSIPSSGQWDAYLAPYESPAGADARYVHYPPKTHFRDNQNGTTTDLVTGLMWPNNWDYSDFGSEMTYEEAENFVEILNNASFAGHNNWVLPTVNQLVSVIQYRPETLHPHYFAGSLGGRWTSTQSPGSGGAEYFTLRAGRYVVAHSSTTADSRPIVVRYDNNYTPPYDFYAGLGMNFEDNGDGTVTDLRTGLTWIKDMSGIAGSSGNWGAALEFCEGLEYPEDGYRDWRLPNMKELVSLVYYGTFDPAVHPDISAISTSYWSSTVDPDDPDDRAYAVNFNKGESSNLSKSISAEIRPVRGPVTEMDYWEERPLETEN